MEVENALIPALILHVLKGANASPQKQEAKNLAEELGGGLRAVQPIATGIAHRAKFTDRLGLIVYQMYRLLEAGDCLTVLPETAMYRLLEIVFGALEMPEDEEERTLKAAVRELRELQFRGYFSALEITVN